MPSAAEIREIVRRRDIFDSVRAKSDWAHDHIIQLNAACQDFFRSNPYRVTKEVDTKTSEIIYRYGGSEKIPREIKRISILR
jgi:hypothetical protein